MNAPARLPFSITIPSVDYECFDVLFRRSVKGSNIVEEMVGVEALKMELGNRERNLIWSGQATEPGEGCRIGIVGQASRFHPTSENSTVRALRIPSKREPSYLMLDLPIRNWRPCHQN